MFYFLKRVNLMLFNDIIHLDSVIIIWYVIKKADQHSTAEEEVVVE
jgi:hypothetical protein